LFEGWDVARAARSGATAIKISFLYDPFASTDPAHAFVSSLVESCRHHELPLFAEPLLPVNTRGDRRTAVIETARTIGALGVDVLKLEFPYAKDSTDTEAWSEACLELTAASPCPWTLLSGGVDLATFSRQLTVACDSGASGYVAGRAIWKDLVATARDDNGGATIEAQRRLQSLTDIAMAHATPWTTWFEESV
jgi:tagatose-1,6-bisphosphate aldolase